MDEKLLKKYCPLTETTYYTLLALLTPCHGYGIIKFVKEVTDGRIVMGTGTLYTMLGRLTADALIAAHEQSEDKKTYSITEDGIMVLRNEILRLEKQLRDGQNVFGGMGK